MDARPRGPAAKRQPSRKGWEIDRENDPSAVSAALDRSSACVIRSLGEQQVPPLRYASVGMTNLLQMELLPRIIDLKITCHPDRSVAKWRDLLFALTGQLFQLEAPSVPFDG
jgi:hypothetical protein